MEIIDELERTELDLPVEPMFINVGPSHPCTHGTIHMEVYLDGETIKQIDIRPGYLHRGFEKSCERGTWQQAFPYVDRLNYCSPMINNVGYALAVEKLLGVEVPERCQVYRVVLSELNRIVDHLVCNAAVAMEQGALTPFWWLLKGRELIWDILEQETGARVMHSFARIGGMAKPPTPELKQSVRDVLPALQKIVADTEKLLVRNRIFIERNQNVGVLTREQALGYGVTGPVLRSTGVDYDVRKAAPYSGYETYDFEIPVGHDGDNMDRFLVRMEEIRQSVRIVEQGLERLADDGPVSIDDPRVVLPPKEEVYSTIEGTIAHFKLIMEGLKPPPGAVYQAVEGGNGELGFYIVSDGSGTPYRVRCRPPCFFNLKAAEEMLRGQMVADIIATFGSINMIGGECDR